MEAKPPLSWVCPEVMIPFIMALVDIDGRYTRRYDIGKAWTYKSQVVDIASPGG
jgi:hypothetical protein